MFELKELGPVTTFLGLRITRDGVNRKLYIDQTEYAKKILDKYGYSDLAGAKTPWPAHVKIPKIWELVPAATDSYISEVASPNFLTIGSRPDMQYTVNKPAEANKGPSKQH